MIEKEKHAMKRRVFALLLTICIVLGAAPAVHAAPDDDTALRTVRAAGIMVGDTSGNLNLGNPITRAEFSKMMIAASI
jgi:hypothetical protein